MYRIAVCDDNMIYAKTICEYLKKWAKIKAVDVEITAFYEGVDLLENIIEYGHYQVVFLDVEIGKMNGLSLAVHIAEQDIKTLIIFMSSYDNYFKQAYKVYPFYFFSKPIDRKELYSVMDRAIAKEENYSQNIRFWYKKVYYSVSIKGILYFFSEGRRVGIMCQDEKSYWFYSQLNEVERIIEKQGGLFARIHQSYFINVWYVKAYHYNYVEMSNQEQLPISRGRRKNVRKLQAELTKGK